MDIMQKLHPQDLLHVTLTRGKNTKTMWVARGKLEKLPDATRCEEHQVAAYGTPDWEAVRETAVS